VLAILAATWSCGDPGYGDEQQEAQDVGTVQQNLWMKTNNSPWSSGHISVCFQPSQDVWENDNADYQAKKVDVRDWLESTYETIPNVDIDLTGWSECPKYADFVRGDEGNDRVEIQLGWGAQGAKTWMSVEMWAGKLRAIHEMGHVLGFQHEQARTDSEGGVGTWTQYVNTPKYCADDDIVYETETGYRVCHEDPPGNEGVYLTKFDFWSILSGTYCHCRAELSDMDKLGLEITYPDTGSLNALPVRPQRGFLMGDGSVVGFTTLKLHNDWFYRGAMAPAFSGGGVEWRTAPYTASGVGDSGGGFAVPSDGVYRSEWEDYAQRQHVSASVTVDIDPPKATAFTMTAI
jgi:hypothetical protein